MFLRKLLNLNLNRNNLNISNAVQENKGYRPIYYTKRTMLFKGVKAIGQSSWARERTPREKEYRGYQLNVFVSHNNYSLRTKILFMIYSVTSRQLQEKSFQQLSINRQRR